LAGKQTSCKQILHRHRYYIFADVEVAEVEVAEVYSNNNELNDAFSFDDDKDDLSDTD
jgi:hypothetical protein